MERAEPLELLGQVVENSWTPAGNKICIRAASRQTAFPFPAACLKSLHFTDSRALTQGNVFNPSSNTVFLQEAAFVGAFQPEPKQR